MRITVESFIRQTLADHSRVTCPRKMLSVLSKALTGASVPAAEAYQLALPHAQKLAAKRPAMRSCARCRTGT